MSVNPNWPNLFAEAAFGANPFYGTTGLTYSDLTPRLYKGWSVNRGKQFELDVVQPGEFQGQWVNTDGYLDPANTSGPFGANLLPFRGFRLRGQYAPTINLMDGNAASGGDLGSLAAGVLASKYGISSFYDASPATQGSASAWAGTRVWQFSIAGGAATGHTLCVFTPYAVGPLNGITYTLTMHVRSVTTGQNPVVQPFIQWLNAAGTAVQTDTGGTVTLTGSPTATWTTITFTSTMPTTGTKVSAAFGLLLTTAPASFWQLQADGMQWEENSSASTFVVPGTNYPIYAGMVERYPETWDFTGTYAYVNPTCVDTMAMLSQSILNEAFIADVANLSPMWFYPFNDASGSTTFQEQNGRMPAVGTFSAGAGAGTITPGTAVTSATPAGKFLGTAGPVVNINNPVVNQGTVIDMTSAGITGAPSGAWTRMIAFRTAQTTGTPIILSYSNSNPINFGYSGNLYVGPYVTTGTNMAMSYTLWNIAGTAVNLNHTTVINDNNWHLLFVTLSADGKTMQLYVDGTAVTTTAASDMHGLTTSSNDSVGGDEYKASGGIGAGNTNWIGDLALYAQWNSVLSAGTITNLTTSFMTAWSGDSSDARYARILGWAGYLGPQALDAGTTTNMGPANDIFNLDALTALQNVVDTEAGRHFVGADGTINFQSRARFFKTITPVATFGENVSGGEIPYTFLSTDFDPTHISNQVTITQVGSNSVYSAADVPSQTSYGIRNLSRNNQSADTEEVRSSAYFYLSRYKDPHMRVSMMRVDLGANPALFPQVLPLELGQYVAYNRRSVTGAPTISQTGFIEQIAHTGDDQGNYQVEYQISPGVTTPYASFTTLATTLASNYTSGGLTITINALPDAATNPLAANLTAGQGLLLNDGTTISTCVVAVGGVPTTSPGWTTATVTITVGMGTNYASGTPVIENVAVTTPPVYNDSLALFDAVQFCY